ncbi:MULTISPECIES: glycosyltransferase family 2 protein [Rahnella]|uniref:Glycosyltransferase family 2 protein n=1 Tax=Rahnella laticis TaxID=2787622 RepID=A0ABS0E8B3_9GAMM|nr:MULTISPECIES: glycosyltransferase family 2 protein [Rahnella]MBF7981335.1 glycosyltransferase family 2 protein [Rahnella laticis]MBF8001427.1 glycosyltransferase family 2 protein [Rahnella sp. LAC-M12]
MITVSCIIPACNEAARIGKVLDVVRNHPLLFEIIVVDDGSADNTADVAREKGVRVVRLATNQGKSHAVAEGIAAATGSHLLMLDADLLGLNGRDITRLVQPVIQNQADVTISLRRNSPWIWRCIGLDYISGERVFARELLATRLDEIRALPNFGLEVWINRLWIAAGSRVRVVSWQGVISPYKAAKMGWLRGLMADMSMMRDIFRTISLRESVQQIIRLRRRSQA